MHAIQLPVLPTELPDGFILKDGAADADAQLRLVEALRNFLMEAPPVPTRVKGGGQTSAAMTNCGPLGWWSDARGYRLRGCQPRHGPALATDSRGLY